MKTFARRKIIVFALGAGLLLSGCSTTTTISRRLPAKVEFTVVESSTEMELTPRQLAELRLSVSNYLREQGLTASGRYYVKVMFPATKPAEAPQWVIVQIDNTAAQTYTVLAAYPGPDDYYPYDYYRTGYDRSYYGLPQYGYYNPPGYPYGAHPRPVSPREDNKHDGRADHPPVTHTRWDNVPRTDADQRRTHDDPPRSDISDQRDHDRSRDHDRNRDRGGSNERYSPVPSAPPRPVAAPPDYHNEPARARDDRRDLTTIEK